MRNVLIGLFLILSVGLSMANAQKAEQISIGTAMVQIGMSKDKVFSELAQRNYVLGKIEGKEEWAVSEKNDQTNLYDVLGMIAFTNGRLSWASRSLVEVTDPGTAKLVRNLYFLVKSFEDSQNVTCKIESDSHEGPEFDGKGISIHCGKRTIKAYVSKFKEQEPQASLDETIK
jgi:hypothetical protein